MSSDGKYNLIGSLPIPQKQMNKTKLDDRIENVLNTFFEPRPEPDELALRYEGNAAILMSDEIPFTEKAEKWTNIVRQALLFVPGAFLLYYMTLSMIFFYPELGVPLQGTLMLLSGAFMCFAGSGSLKNTKNLIIPASITATAIFTALIASLFTGSLQSDMYFWYSIYLFPVALILSKVFQMFINEK